MEWIKVFFSCSKTYSVSGREVDPQPPGPGGEEEDEDVGSCLEVGDHVASFADLGRSVQPHERVLPVGHVLLQQVDHPRHLGVDQDAVALFF